MSRFPNAMTAVRFVSGMDGVHARPSVARQAGLGCRFAVVQDTHVEGQDDMVFDEALWRSLVDFALELGDRVEVVARTGRRSRPQSLSAWMEAFEAAPADDRSPPELVLVHEGNHLKACMVTEF